MKRQQLGEIKQLEIKALLVKVNLAKAELTDLILDKNMKKLKDVKVIFKKRHDIAQMLTVVRQKKLLGEIEGKIENKKVEQPVKKVVKKATVKGVK